MGTVLRLWLDFPRSLHLDAYPVLSLCCSNAPYCFFHMFEGLDVAERGRGKKGKEDSEIHWLKKYPYWSLSLKL